jgi:triacylglycerol esterase/lipase EstA (alpha/beta hydrolase family)
VGQRSPARRDGAFDGFARQETRSYAWCEVRLSKLSPPEKPEETAAANAIVTEAKASDPARSGREHHQVLLVPGCFGFGSLGELSYFSGVREQLAESFSRAGVDVTVTEVKTLPTASIRVRAARVLEALVAVAENSAGPIHVIGHSTGGLDARLAIAPTAALPTTARLVDPSRVHTLVSVCCPHFGTPIASFFGSTLGKPMLRLVSRYWMWLLRRGRIPVALLLRLGWFFVRLRDPWRRRKGTFDELYEKLFRDLGDERRLELIQFLDAISSDQALVFQLTPAGCDLLNACTADPALHYASVVARARPPTFGTFVRSIRDLYSQLVHPVFAALHFIAGRGDAAAPPPSAEQAAALTLAYGEVPGSRDSDGVVPTLSQVWGDLVHATTADHLDVVGQFGRTGEAAWGGDWIPSYSGFTNEHFAALWSDVATYAIEKARAPKRRGSLLLDETPLPSDSTAA